MKKYYFLLCLLLCIKLNAQSGTDVSRIVLNAYVIDKDNKVPDEAKGQLLSKLAQIATEFGVGGAGINPRFVIAARINIGTKDIIAGPPQMIALNAEAIFFIGDAADNSLYANASISLKGVGTNENKALINAIQQISPKNKLLEDLVNRGKNKIVEYYSKKCDFISTRANTLSQKQKFDEAIYELMQVPEVCKSCYDKCMQAVQPIYQKKIDREALLAVNKAKNIWQATPNKSGADQIAEILASIDPLSASYEDAVELTERVRKKIEADEKRDWDFKIKKYTDGVKLEQQRIDAARQIAVSFYQNQPSTIIYNRVFW